MDINIGLWSVFAIFICIDLTISIVQQGSFVIEVDKRIATLSYEEAITDSIVDCSRVCHSSEKCTGANYLADTRTCYLYNQTCFRMKHAPGWTYLRRPLAERTFHFMSNKTETWDGAKQYCESIGGGLATVYTTTDHEMILNVLSQYPDSIVWLGGSDRESEGEWIWTNGLRFDDQDFNFWGPNQPNNIGNNQHCLDLRQLSLDGMQWNDWYCDRNLTFVCEIYVA